MGRGRQMEAILNFLAELDGAGARASPCAVRAGNEGWPEAGQTLDVFPQGSVAVGSLRRKDLERQPEFSRTVNVTDAHERLARKSNERSNSKVYTRFQSHAACGAEPTLNPPGRTVASDVFSRNMPNARRPFLFGNKSLAFQPEGMNFCSEWHVGETFPW